MEPEILINEVHPNPESGSEWIELLLVKEIDENFSLTNFTIFDNLRQIYKFSNELFINQLLVVEVSGLNNDTDSVILKDAQGNILDSFTYDKTEKGLSWSRKQLENIFILTSPSRNLQNPSITLTPTPIVTSTPTQTPTQTTTSGASSTENQATNSPEGSSQLNNHSTEQLGDLFKKYDLSKIKLTNHNQEIGNRKLRLVFLGTQLRRAEFLNAIIGSFLIIVSASFIIYAKIKNKHRHKLLSSLFFASVLGWLNIFLI